MHRVWLNIRENLTLGSNLGSARMPVALEHSLFEINIIVILNGDITSNDEIDLLLASILG